LYLSHRVRSLRRNISAVLLLLLGIAVLPLVPTPIRAQVTPGLMSAAKPQPGQADNHQDHQGTVGGHYYIEFRVAQIGTYGHSYAAYGNVGGVQNYADLHPMGGYAVMALGHVLRVPANTQWDPDVLKLPVASRYRRAVNAEQYQKLLAAVNVAKANKSPYWNAVTNNCNHFIGELAQAVGLKVPEQFQVSYTFVPALKELNEAGSDATGRTSHERRAAAAPRS
jgi:hypothetical protein